MIVLDTNVISEPMRAVPEPLVMGWMDSKPTTELHLTAVTAAELLYGVKRLPSGERRATLGRAITDLIDQEFDSRILAFDHFAAQAYAKIVSHREGSGQPIGIADGQIAAICRHHEATLATRNLDDFADTGIDLVNPWTDDLR